MSRRILERSGGVTGEIAAFLTLAAEQAIRRGDERITLDLLDSIGTARRVH